MSSKKTLKSKPKIGQPVRRRPNSNDLNRIIINQQITIELQGYEGTEEYQIRTVEGAFRGIFRLGKYDLMT